ncbi:hypothetical protein SDC9_201746 [bioreactor metagenome]|uniref:Uncharacterized protein n=1 Tax=bioreactor metagenome TaxID=1076179 RepID=A0A645IS77_9ZZZZ
MGYQVVIFVFSGLNIAGGLVDELVRFPAFRLEHLIGQRHPAVVRKRSRRRHFHHRQGFAPGRIGKRGDACDGGAVRHQRDFLGAAKRPEIKRNRRSVAVASQVGII